jgi:ACS family sodium-dependent inorganic phosphate cotransporter
MQEKEFILQNTQQQLSNNHKFNAPWRAILTSRACWALFIVHTCSNYGFYTYLTSIPKYMNEVLKFDIKFVSKIYNKSMWFVSKI